MASPSLIAAVNSSEGQNSSPRPGGIVMATARTISRSLRCLLVTETKMVFLAVGAATTRTATRAATRNSGVLQRTTIATTCTSCP